jgi:hypothetical protein
MSKNSVVMVVVAGIFVTAVCVLVFGAPNRPNPQPTYQVEVQSDYGVDPVQSDSSKALDLADKVVSQSGQATLDQLASVSAKLDRVLEKLDAIDKQNASLGKRLAAIEKHLGITAPAAATPPAAPAPAPAPQVPQQANPVN